MTADTVTGAAPAGRPRDPRVDDALLAATRHLLGEVGYKNLAMRDVARAAGASKASLYRRWPSKLPLVVDALHSWAETMLVPNIDTGTVRGDMVALLETMERRRDTEFIHAIAAEMLTNPELADACRRPVSEWTLEPLRLIVRRGIERNELPRTTDVEILADVIPAIYLQWRVTGRRAGMALAERVIAQFFP